MYNGLINHIPIGGHLNCFGDGSNYVSIAF